MASVLLVHGAWHGAWCWAQVLDALERAGIEADAIDLPGHGDDPGPFEDLHGDAARVRERLDKIDGPVVLLGHSYGGAVITEAGDHPSVSRLVYLAALALDEDEACSSAGGEQAAALSNHGRTDLGCGFRVEDGLITLDPEIAMACFYQDCDPELATQALRQLGAQPLITFQQRPSTVAWRVKPSTYVVCADDQGIHPGLERILARRCHEILEWPTGHSPFLSRPDLVAELVTRLAR